MKYCPQCGEPIENETTLTCPRCGASLSDGNGAEVPVAESSARPMKWYKFLIYFLLWFSAVLNFVTGILTATGLIYNMETGVTAEQIYNFFGIALRIHDIIFGLLLIVIAVIAVTARQHLKAFKKTGPKLLYTIYIIDLALSIIQPLFSGVVVGTTITIDWTSLAGSVAILAANITYFKKREHLFCN